MSLNDKIITKDNVSTEEKIDEDFEDKYLYNVEEDSGELKVVLKFGYIVEIDGERDIRFDIGNEKVIDQGLITGLTQNDELVDVCFLGNDFMKDKNVEFDKNFVKTNGKKYKYDNLSINMSNNEAYVVSKYGNDFIVKLNGDASEMFSSIIGNEKKSENSCIISVVESKICACFVSDGEVLLVLPIDIGKNKFIEDENYIIVKGQEINLDECYLRACIKHIYLHVNVENPSKTLIVGKVKNPFYEMKDEEIQE